MAAAKKPGPSPEEMNNPITGQPANSFTKVTNREMHPPTLRAQPPAEVDAASKLTMHQQHKAATAPGGVVDGQLGYGRPHGMSPMQFSQVMGAHRMFPNEAAKAGTPAINEPHAASPNVTVQRRAEDLSGPEYRKGEQTLRNYGYGEHPVKELTDITGRHIDRVIGEHAAAGVEESNSQHFYGGAPVTSDVGHYQDVHNAGIRAANDRFHQGVEHLLSHPQFQARQAGRSPEEQKATAMGAMAQATADTSPNSKWRTSKGWPNMEQAEASAVGGLTGARGTTGKPNAVNGGIPFVTGRVQNHDKAAIRVDEMTSGSTEAHTYGEPYTRVNSKGKNERVNPERTAPKTIAFRGALGDPNSPDAYKVTDIHAAADIIPGANSSKSRVFEGPVGPGGKVQKVNIYPDQPESAAAGLKPVLKKAGEEDEGDDVDTKPGQQKAGNSRAEQMLSHGGNTVHALHDYATRQALTDRGLSRGVNYADNVHHQQAATWGSQQVRRPDVAVAHADQYPVVRNWAAEGHTPPMTELGERMFGGHTRSMGPQFMRNPNTTGIDKNPAPGTTGKQDVTRNKPYPVMPGER